MPHKPTINVPQAYEELIEPPAKSWTLPEFFDEAERAQLMFPGARALVGAVARAWYFMTYLLEDLPARFLHKSSAETALFWGIIMVEAQRDGTLPKPREGATNMSLDTMHITVLKALAIVDAALATSLDALEARQLRHILWAMSDYLDKLKTDLDAEMDLSPEGK